MTGIGGREYLWQSHGQSLLTPDPVRSAILPSAWSVWSGHARALDLTVMCKGQQIMGISRDTLW